MTTQTYTAHITEDQRRMLDFGLRWAEFGGGASEDIFVDFGVSDRVFFHRLGKLVSDSEVVDSEVIRAQLLDVCRSRISKTQVNPNK